MPLSKCRYCGKKVPNMFRPYHEKVACIVARKARGEYIDPKAKRLQKKREIENLKRQEEEEKHRPQKRLVGFLEAKS